GHGRPPRRRRAGRARPPYRCRRRGTAVAATPAAHPLCEECRQRGAGPESARHRQVHVRAHGKESCVDIHLASLLARLWEVCDTTSSCQDYGGRAYVRPTADIAAAAERYLREELGLEVETEDGSSGSGCRTRSHWCRRR